MMVTPLRLLCTIRKNEVLLVIFLSFQGILLFLLIDSTLLSRKILKSPKKDIKKVFPFFSQKNRAGYFVNACSMLKIYYFTSSSLSVTIPVQLFLALSLSSFGRGIKPILLRVPFSPIIFSLINSSTYSLSPGIIPIWAFLT